MKRELVDVEGLFPVFGARLRRGLGDPIERVLPGATPAELGQVEARVGLELPPSYRALLRCTRGLWLLGGVVRFSELHPFVERGPASESLLCFAEFVSGARRSQLLFDTNRRSADGECPVVHVLRAPLQPPAKELAPSFRGWLEEFLEYPAFRSLDDADKDR